MGLAGHPTLCGTATVPTCIDCHDLKDRYPLFAWPMSVVGSMLQGCKAEPAMELLVALADSMPERYRDRFASEPLPTRLHAPSDWSTEDLVTSVLAATTTEARLYLAHVLAVSSDWRRLDGDQRPRQDSNLRPAD
jgi:hypothetical protein